MRKPGEITFEDAVYILMKIFSDKSSLFNSCYRSMNLTKKENENIVTYVDIVKKDCEKFRIKNGARYVKMINYRARFNSKERC